MTETEARKTVKCLKKFYSELVWFAMGNALFILIWFMFDRFGNFWPKYIFLVWGISLIVAAYHNGILDHYLSKLFILTQKWEDEKVTEITGRKKDQRRVPLYKYWKK